MRGRVSAGLWEGKVSMSTDARLIQHLEEARFQQKCSNKRKEDGPLPSWEGPQRSSVLATSLHALNNKYTPTYYYAMYN